MAAKTVRMEVRREQRATVAVVIDDADPKFAGWLTAEGKIAGPHDARWDLLAGDAADDIDSLDWGDGIVTTEGGVIVNGVAEVDEETQAVLDLRDRPPDTLPGPDGVSPASRRYWDDIAGRKEDR